MRTLALTAFALMASAGSALAGPAVWTVDKATSKLGFTGSMSGQDFNGAFTRWDAQIAFDPNDLPASRVTARIDTGSARTGDQTRDEALPTGDWFSVKLFPQASFVSTQITADGPGRYVARGQLTIRNVTQPVSLPFSLVITGGTARMTGSVPLDRSVFGVGQGQWKTGDAVALKVQVDVAITAKRAS